MLNIYNDTSRIITLLSNEKAINTLQLITSVNRFVDGGSIEDPQHIAQIINLFFTWSNITTIDMGVHLGIVMYMGLSLC